MTLQRLFAASATSPSALVPLISLHLTYGVSHKHWFQLYISIFNLKGGKQGARATFQQAYFLLSGHTYQPPPLPAPDPRRFDAPPFTPSSNEIAVLRQMKTLEKEHSTLEKNKLH